MLRDIFLMCLILTLIESNFLLADKEFCDYSVRDSLLIKGGIFSYDDIVYAIRNDKKEDNTVWRFKFKVIGEQTILKNSKLEVIKLPSIQMKKLFPDSFKYFISGFAITNTISCTDQTSKCANTLSMKNLTLILGPKSKKVQKYMLYRFNGQTFDLVKSGDDSIPPSVAINGTTKKWFTPSSLISSITFRHNRKELIAFNYEEKSINKMDVKLLTDKRISNRYWNRLMFYDRKDSSFYNLIELKISHNNRVIVLITEEMVYEMVSDKKLIEYMHPWDLFDCKSANIIIRSVNSQLMDKHLKQEQIEWKSYDSLYFIAVIITIIADILYLGLLFAIYYILFNSYKNMKSN